MCRSYPPYLTPQSLTASMQTVSDSQYGSVAATPAMIAGRTMKSCENMVVRTEKAINSTVA